MANESMRDESRARYVVSDIDGTLAQRDEPIAERTVRLLHALAEERWRIALLTGQHIGNIRPRVIHPMRQALGSDAPCLEIHTCEGARRWIYRNGRLRADTAWNQARRFSELERRAIDQWLGESLWPLLEKGNFQVAQQPQWWEDAVLVLKLEGPDELRACIAHELASRLNVSVLDQRPHQTQRRVRVGVAGRTSLVIAPSAASKRSVLEDILGGTYRPDPVLYIADEFVVPGNDAVTLGVPGVIKISVDEAHGPLPAEVLHAGQGPPATDRWLTMLLDETRRMSRSGRECTGEALLARLQACC